MKSVLDCEMKKKTATLDTRKWWIQLVYFQVKQSSN